MSGDRQFSSHNSENEKAVTVKTAFCTSATEILFKETTCTDVRILMILFISVRMDIHMCYFKTTNVFDYEVPLRVLHNMRNLY